MNGYVPWLRIVGTHALAQEVLADAADLSALGIVTALPAVNSLRDYAQIDPELETDPADIDGIEPPALGLGYAGLSDSQRYAFLKWAAQPDAAAPPAFRQLYCASLEVDLIEASTNGGQRLRQLHDRLAKLMLCDAWRGDLWLSHLWLLDALLNSNHDASTDFTPDAIAPSLAGVALGLQALCKEPMSLTAHQVIWLGHTWRIAAASLDPALVALRLDEACQRGVDLLSDALAALPENARLPKPWRTAHRDLRFALPQPDLRTTLEPRLRELLAATTSIVTALEGDDAIEGISDTDTSTEADAGAEANIFAYNQSAAPQEMRESTTSKAKAKSKRSGRTATTSADEWQLIVEFTEGRSQYTIFALEVAQKLPGYTTLLDEDRTIVHRILMRKSEMRRFWRLWDYIQGWSSTRVYLNGKELEKWQVWPWSHYLR